MKADIGRDEDDFYERELERRERLKTEVLPKEEHFTSEAIAEAVEQARLIQLQLVEDEIEYGCFNDPEVWEPLFASGTMPEPMRFQLDEPLMTSASLRAAVGYADLHNMERADAGKIEQYGYIQVRTRTVTRTPWREVPYEQRRAVQR